MKTNRVLLGLVSLLVGGSLGWDAYSASSRSIEANLVRGLSTVQIKNGLTTYSLPVSQSTSTLTIATNSDASTLSNKTINGASNTLLGISRSAIVAGTAQRVLVNNGSGNLSDGPAPGSDGNVLTASGGVWTSATNSATVSTSVITLNSTSYTATTSNNIIYWNAVGGAATLNLYTAAGNSGRQITISKIDFGSNCITIDPNASETIQSALTQKICTPLETLTLIADPGALWRVWSHTFPNDPATSAGVTSNWTNTTTTSFYSRNNAFVDLDIYLVATNEAVGSALVLTFPAALTIDTARLATAASSHTKICDVMAYDSGTLYRGVMAYASSTTVLGYIQGTNAPLTDLTADTPINFDTGDTYHVTCHYPVVNWW